MTTYVITRRDAKFLRLQGRNNTISWCAKEEDACCFGNFSGAEEYFLRACKANPKEYIALIKDFGLPTQQTIKHQDCTL